MHFSITDLSFEETQAARAAIHALRTKDSSARAAVLAIRTKDSSNGDEQSDLAKRIETALANDPPNAARRGLLEVLYEAPEDVWLSSATLATNMATKGITAAKMAAALGYISYLMGHGLPRETANLQHKISILAQRSKSGGLVSYRLSPAGRIAVQHVLTGAWK